MNFRCDRVPGSTKEKHKWETLKGAPKNRSF